MGEVCENHYNAKPQFRLIIRLRFFGVFNCFLAEILPTSNLFISLESSLNGQYFVTKINTLNQNLGEL